MAHATAEKMKAVAIERFGGLDELKLFDLPKPKPEPDEVLIRVRAAGVGIWDNLQRSGELPVTDPHFPLVLGAECAGDITELGAGVTTLHEGQAVYTYFFGKQGAYAEFVAVKADEVALKPSTLSYVQAAAVPTDGITAHQAVVDALQLQAGEWIFVAGGSGGVGSMAVQIAANLGARVIASARAENFGFLESLGVERANLIDYTESDVPKAVRKITGGAGADAALDAAGGASSLVTIQAVRDAGRLAELTGQELPAERNVSVAHIQSEPSAARLDALRELIDAGHLKVHVQRTFPLAHAREAQAALEGRHALGKIVLTVD